MKNCRIRTWGILLIIMMLLSACARKTSPASATPEETRIHIEPETAPIVIETEEEENESTEEPETYEPWERMEADGMVRSYLTGEKVPAAVGNRRPVAVMMSNDKAALPQYGINRAGVIYEAPVEGDMNRYMAIIENYDDLDRIGSVRSCRDRKSVV